MGTTPGRREEMADDTTRKTRDADATRARILAAAKKEFAKSGLGGARVDEIADRAKANKRMIYHYFGNKEDLFRIVLEEAYTDIRTAEQSLELEHLPARDALEKLIRFTWDYYLKNPEFITLVNSENLHKGRHLRRSKRVRAMHSRLVALLDDVLERGVREGVFRRGIDPVQLYISLAAEGYFYLSNRYTLSRIFGRDLMTKRALAARARHMSETILNAVRK